MEEEINLHEYVEILIRNWFWVVGMALLAAVLAFVASSFAPRMYEAEAQVLVTGSNYRLNFDSRFQSLDNIGLAGRILPSLAESNDILARVLENPNTQIPPEYATLGKLKGMLSAESGNDASLVLLRVRSQNPQMAAQLANTWAVEYVGWVNEFMGSGEAELEDLELQRDQAQKRLEAIEAEQVDFQALNQSRILKNEIESLSGQQRSYLASKQDIEAVILDAQALKSVLEAGTAEQPVVRASNLSLILLEARAFGVSPMWGYDGLSQTDANASFNVAVLPQSRQLPVQIGIDSQPSNMTNREAIDLVDQLILALEDKSNNISERLTTLQPQILDLQGRLQKYDAKSTQLERDLMLTEETFSTLARKVDEARVRSETLNGDAKVTSLAVVPNGPVSPRRLFNTVAGGLIGGVLAVVAVYVVHYWRQEAA